MVSDVPSLETGAVLHDRAIWCNVEVIIALI